MAKLVWTDEALRWLEDIFEHIAQDNPDAAARTVQGIYDRAQALVHHPEMGERYAGSERHVRILLYDRYRIAYLVKPERVEVLGVFSWSAGYHSLLILRRYRKEAARSPKRAAGVNLPRSRSVKKARLKPPARTTRPARCHSLRCRNR